MEPDPDAPQPRATDAAVPRMPCPRCRKPTLVEVWKVEPALKMAGLVVLLFWSSGIGWPLILACAAIVTAAWPPRRRWSCERLVDCGYEQPLV